MRSADLIASLASVLPNGRELLLIYCGSVIAAATEHEHDGKNNDPGAVVVKDVA